ncbi:MAG: VWA domain-containing protein [Gilvibacter sp.]
MVQWEEQIYFYLFGIIPIVVLLYFAVILWRKRVQSRFATKELLGRLTPTRSVFKGALKLIVLCLAFACLTLAIVNPKIGTKLETIKREGVDVVFALDVSKSMLAEDIAPNRLDKSKQLVTQIVNSLSGDRVGIIGYAGSAFPQLPITTDFAAAKMFLSSMNTDMVSSQGTAISEAITMAQTYFDDEEQTNRVLFIVSDGEDHEGQALAIAKQAADNGIRIFTIGVGTEGDQNWIPIKRNGELIRYKRDQSGERVVTNRIEETLKDIADAANGSYIDGNNTKKVLEEVTALLNGMDKSTFEAKQFADFKDQFQWFIAAAILLLILDVLFLDRRTHWLIGLNLFNEKEE